MEGGKEEKKREGISLLNVVKKLEFPLRTFFTKHSGIRVASTV